MTEKLDEYRILCNGSKYKVQKKFFIKDNVVGFYDTKEDWIDLAEKKWWSTPKTILYKSLEKARASIQEMIIKEHGLDWGVTECVSYSPDTDNLSIETYSDEDTEDEEVENPEECEAVDDSKEV